MSKTYWTKPPEDGLVSYNWQVRAMVFTAFGMIIVKPYATVSIYLLYPTDDS